MSTKIIKNTTPITQFIFWKQGRYEIKPGEDQAFAEEVANKFLVDLAGKVVLLASESDFSGFEEVIEKPTWVYLANMTGNPDASTTTRAMRYDKQLKEDRWTEIPNPVKQPRDLTWIRDMGQVAAVDQWGKDFFQNQPPRLLRLPVYKRMRFSAEDADYILMQESHNRGGEYGGAVVRSREVKFCPHVDWDLDDMRIFLEMLDPNVPLPAAKADLVSTDQEAKEKYLCLQRIHFRISDPDFPLIAEEDFKAEKAKRSKKPEVPQRAEQKQVQQAAR